MTKILLTGDLHLSGNPRDTYRFAFLNYLAEMASAHKPDRIVIAGDLTEEKDRHPATLVNLVVQALTKLAEAAPVVCLEGNHDYKEEGHAFFQFVNAIPRVTWVHEPRMFNWEPKTLMLPHTNRWKEDWKWLIKNGWDCEMIICHQTMESANVGFGRKLDGIPLETFDGVPLVFGGDIHVPQSIGKKFHYIGAPYTVDFGDEYESRVIIVDKPGPKGWRSFDTSILPQKRLLTLGPGDRSVKGQTFNENDICQIKVHVDDLEGWPDLRDRIKESAEKRGAVVWSINPVMIKKAVNRQRLVQAKESDAEVLDSFGKRHRIKPGLLKTGHKLLT